MAPSSKPQRRARVRLEDGSKVEIRVEGDWIWVEDFTRSGRARHVLAIPRRKLKGCPTACSGVQAVHQARAKVRAAGMKAAARASVLAPKTAGYWFVDENSTALARPVVVLEQ